MLASGSRDRLGMHGVRAPERGQWRALWQHACKARRVVERLLDNPVATAREVLVHMNSLRWAGCR